LLLVDQIVSAQTDFQRVDIYDVLRPHFQSMDDYQQSQVKDGSYKSLHPELFEPDRIVFLDGVLQSRRSGDAPYHEALVHPSMFAHRNPKRVAIIGGGEGATLREVLKHKTVEKVVMIEIDEKMVDLSREYLPFWSDCSTLAGSAASCFDDPRVEVYYEDAFKWFIDHYMTGGGETDNLVEPFDVIIMDVL
jgi:spermidine synthase